MAHDTLKLTDQKVLTAAREVLQVHLPLEADGYQCTTANPFDALLGVAVNSGTLEAVCTDWLGISQPETIRGYLNAQLRVDELPALERHLNAALAERMPARLKRQAQRVAIDLHDRPYCGKRSQDEGYWVRGAARDGTTRFDQFATADVMLNGLRVTLAIHFVLPENDTVSVLENLLK